MTNELILTHIDIGDSRKIKALCGKKPDGVDSFTYVNFDDPLPNNVTCQKCRDKFQKREK